MPLYVSLLTLFLLTLTPSRAQWEQIKVPEAGTFMSIANSGKTMFAATSGGIFRSRDSGGSWVKVSVWTVSSCESIAVIGNNVFACMAGGYVYRSQDDGESWKRGNEGLDFGATPTI